MYAKDILSISIQDKIKKLKEFLEEYYIFDISTKLYRSWRQDLVNFCNDSDPTKLKKKYHYSISTHSYQFFKYDYQTQKRKPVTINGHTLNFFKFKNISWENNAIELELAIRSIPLGMGAYGFVEPRASVVLNRKYNGSILYYEGIIKFSNLLAIKTEFQQGSFENGKFILRSPSVVEKKFEVLTGIPYTQPMNRMGKGKPANAPPIPGLNKAHLPLPYVPEISLKKYFEMASNYKDFDPKRGNLDLNLKIAWEILLSFSRLAHNEVLHGDIKPENIQICMRDGEILVQFIDLEGMTAINEKGVGLTTTLLYRDILIFTGEINHTNALTDLYSVGITLMDLFTFGQLSKQKEYRGWCQHLFQLKLPIPPNALVNFHSYITKFLREHICEIGKSRLEPGLYMDIKDNRIDSIIETLLLIVHPDQTKRVTLPSLLKFFGQLNGYNESKINYAIQSVPIQTYVPVNLGIDDFAFIYNPQAVPAFTPPFGVTSPSQPHATLPQRKFVNGFYFDL